MAKRKITKEELKSPDAFMSFADKVGNYLSENWKPIATILGIAAVGGIAYTATEMVNAANEEAAKTAIFKVETKILDVRRAQMRKEQEIVESYRKEDEEGNVAELSEDQKEKIEKEIKALPQLDFAKDFAQLAKQLEVAIQNHSDTRSADHARLRLAKLYMDYEKYEDAARVIQSAVKNSKKGTSLYGLARTQLASALSFQEQYDQSVTLLEEILMDKELDYLHAEALLKLGVLQRQMGNLDKAKEVFRRLTTEFADSSAGQVAKNHLKLIRFIEPKATDKSDASSIDVE